MSDPTTSAAAAAAADGNAAPTRDEEQPEPLSFTLTIVSPSVGAIRLEFPHLPATTTVEQLKAKIRDALPSKPANELQRLIHRGRMLARESQTMLEIFGQDVLCHPESQILHLVLRPAEDNQTPAAFPAPRPQSIPPAPIPSATPPPVSAPQLPLVNGGVFGSMTTRQLPPPQPRPQSTPAVPGHGMHAQQPLPGFQHVQQHRILHEAEQYHNMIAQRLQQLQRETQRLQQEMGSIESRYRDPARMGLGNQGVQPGMAIPFFNPAAADNPAFQGPVLGMRPPHGMPPSVQNFINQQQRGRAAEGLTGAQSGSRTPGGTVRASSLGRASPSRRRPEHTTTYTREGVGPNGERWQMTVNETTTTLPIGSASVHHHHQAPQSSTNPALDIQAVLRNADRQLASQNDMLRSTSNPNPLRSPELNGGNATNSSLTPSPGVTDNATTANNTQNSESMVYILSSPQGPRALLVSNSESYFTPRQSSRRRRHDAAQAAVGQGEAAAPIGLPEYRNRPAVRARRGNNEGVAPVQAAHANPGAGALAARIGQILWLIVRLVMVVWFLTSGDSSWTRWFMVTGMALAIFIINTGLFNGAGDQLWGPIRRHLEALLPLADPDAAMVPAANAVIPQAEVARENNPAGQRGANNEPSPESVAARLIEQRRRADVNWFMIQVRRAEHALLLFLASLVPGVGERHIAAREAEAAERQRRIDAAVAAAEEAHRQADAPQETPTDNAPAANDGVAPGPNEPPVEPEPLIQV
ncbi:hypothetical protein HYALB_00003942 [Hymenoscyphus albidus]|uniref:Ubiquitin-like domain-containing protein n=1 Tax=Hymenoscyphus albidus TaxID=595503 RepID=A0A9N9LTD0_9HELO|nr:hypothetical protein HYALB_00003942 [Hymenoscyphus albidus]